MVESSEDLFQLHFDLLNVLVLHQSVHIVLSIRPVHFLVLMFTVIDDLLTLQIHRYSLIKYLVLIQIAHFQFF